MAQQGHLKHTLKHGFSQCPKKWKQTPIYLIQVYGYFKPYLIRQRFTWFYLGIWQVQCFHPGNFWRIWFRTQWLVVLEYEPEQTHESAPEQHLNTEKKTIHVFGFMKRLFIGRNNEHIFPLFGPWPLTLISKKCNLTLAMSPLCNSISPLPPA